MGFGMAISSSCAGAIAHLTLILSFSSLRISNFRTFFTRNIAVRIRVRVRRITAWHDSVNPIGLNDPFTTSSLQEIAESTTNREMFHCSDQFEALVLRSPFFFLSPIQITLETRNNSGEKNGIGKINRSFILSRAENCVCYTRIIPCPRSNSFIFKRHGSCAVTPSYLHYIALHWKKPNSSSFPEESVHQTYESFDPLQYRPSVLQPMRLPHGVSISSSILSFKSF